VRELENAIERALIFSSGQITEEHLFLGSKNGIIGLDEMNLLKISEVAQRNAETAAILQALSLHNGNKTKSAKTLGVSYKTLLTKIKTYELEVPEVTMNSENNIPDCN